MKPSLPSRKRHWLKELKKALRKSLAAVETAPQQGRLLYTYAPEMAAHARKIVDSATLDRMQERARSMYEYDRQVDTQAADPQRFHFVSSYIFSHVEAELISEREGDVLMEYACRNMDLFDDDR